MRFPALEAVDENVVVVLEDRGTEIRQEEEAGTAALD